MPQEFAASEVQRVRRPQVWCYRSIPLYRPGADGGLGIFKKRGVTLGEMGITDKTLPDDLVVLRKDKLAALGEVQQGLNMRIGSMAKAGDHAGVKEMVVQIVEETFTDPRMGNLMGLCGTVTGLVAAYSDMSAALRQMALMTHKDYSTALHSVNVAALVIAYGLKVHHDDGLVAELGVGALLHDLGKLMVPQDILTAQRKLTEEEFRQIRKHPIRGLELIDESLFPSAVPEAIGEHHEKLDGSGYPYGIRDVSYVGQLVGLVDCYEALTSDERVYRAPMTPLDTLKLLQADVRAGKFSLELFESFAYSLI